jgi:hypothetical protein
VSELTDPSDLRMARPERFELPTTKFVAWYSIQLSYGREAVNYSASPASRQAPMSHAPMSTRHAKPPPIASAR